MKKLASGPGRLCQAFAIDLGFNGERIGQRVKVKTRPAAVDVASSRRIGISKAVDLDWRFYEIGNPYVSG
jgi:DNA-3-methyladenine glycosylase